MIKTSPTKLSSLPGGNEGEGDCVDCEPTPMYGTSRTGSWFALREASSCSCCLRQKREILRVLPLQQSSCVHTVPHPVWLVVLWYAMLWYHTVWRHMDRFVRHT